MLHLIKWNATEGTKQFWYEVTIKMLIMRIHLNH